MILKRAFIPNMITMGNMIFGFFAIIFASKGTPQALATAGVLIFAASFCDLLDGATARALKVQSEIGGQLDSLADAVSYGIAPGIIAYQGYLKNLPSLGGSFDVGMLIAPLFPVFTIYRLARFNLGEEKSGFSGLPSPPAGIIVSAVPALAITTIPFFGLVNFVMPMPIFIIFFLGIGFLMISTVDYKKVFSDLWRKGVAARIITISVILFLFIFFKMWAVFIVTGLYVAAGLVNYVVKLLGHSQAD